MQRDEGTEAVGCAIMILVRQEPAWDEAMRHADADTLIGKVRTAPISSLFLLSATQSSGAIS